MKIKIKDHDIHYHVISFDDLIESKTRSVRPKDLMDVFELKKIRKNEIRLREDKHRKPKL